MVNDTVEDNILYIDELTGAKYYDYAWLTDPNNSISPYNTNTDFKVFVDKIKEKYPNYILRYTIGADNTSSEDGLIILRAERDTAGVYSYEQSFARPESITDFFSIANGVIDDDELETSFVPYRSSGISTLKISELPDDVLTTLFRKQFYNNTLNGDVAKLSVEKVIEDGNLYLVIKNGSEVISRELCTDTWAVDLFGQPTFVFNESTLQNVSQNIAGTDLPLFDISNFNTTYEINYHGEILTLTADEYAYLEENGIFNRDGKVYYFNQIAPENVKISHTLVFDSGRRKIILTDEEYESIKNGEISLEDLIALKQGSDESFYNEHIMERILNDKYTANMEVRRYNDGYDIYANGVFVCHIKSDEIENIETIGDILDSKLEELDDEIKSELDNVPNNNAPNKALNQFCINFDNERHYNKIIDELNVFKEYCNEAKGKFGNALDKIKTFETLPRLSFIIDNLKKIGEDSDYLQEIIRNIVRVYLITDADLKSFFDYYIVSDLFKNAGLYYDSINKDKGDFNYDVNGNIRVDVDKSERNKYDMRDNNTFISNLESLIEEAGRDIQADYAEYQNSVDSGGNILMSKDELFALCGLEKKAWSNYTEEEKAKLVNAYCLITDSDIYAAYGLQIKAWDDYTEAEKEKIRGMNARIENGLNNNPYTGPSDITGAFEGFFLSSFNETSSAGNFSVSLSLMDDLGDLLGCQDIKDDNGTLVSTRYDYVGRSKSFLKKFDYVREFSDISNLQFVRNMETLRASIPYYRIALSDLFYAKLEDVRKNRSNYKGYDSTYFDQEIAIAEVLGDVDSDRLKKYQHKNKKIGVREGKAVLITLDTWGQEESVSVIPDEDLALIKEYEELGVLVLDSNNMYSNNIYSKNNEISKAYYERILHQDSVNHRKGRDEAIKMLKRLANGDTSVYNEIFSMSAINSFLDGTVGGIPSLFDPSRYTVMDEHSYKIATLLDFVGNMANDSNYASSAALKYSNGEISLNEFNAIKSAIISSIGDYENTMIEAYNSVGEGVGKLTGMAALVALGTVGGGAFGNLVNTIKILNAAGHTASDVYLASGGDVNRASVAGAVRGLLHFAAIIATNRIVDRWSEHMSDRYDANVIDEQLNTVNEVSSDAAINNMAMTSVFQSALKSSVAESAVNGVTAATLENVAENAGNIVGGTDLEFASLEDVGDNMTEDAIGFLFNIFKEGI